MVQELSGKSSFLNKESILVKVQRLKSLSTQLRLSALTERSWCPALSSCLHQPLGKDLQSFLCRECLAEASVGTRQQVSRSGLVRPQLELLLAPRSQGLRLPWDSQAAPMLMGSLHFPSRLAPVSHCTEIPAKGTLLRGRKLTIFSLVRNISFLHGSAYGTDSFCR